MDFVDENNADDNLLDRIVAEVSKIKPAKQVKKQSERHDHSERALSKYEQRVDFAQAKKVLDKSEADIKHRLKDELKKIQDSTLKWIQDNGANLKLSDVSGFTIDQSPELQQTLKDMFETAWTDGRDAGASELPAKVRKAPAVRDVKTFSDWIRVPWYLAQWKEIAYHSDIDGFGPGALTMADEWAFCITKRYANAFEPTDALNAFENRAWLIQDVMDAALQSQVRYELFEHLKGGRTLGDTMDNIRQVFEPWIGDPSKIEPGSEDLLQAFRLENIVRTESTWAYSQGRMAVGDAAGEYVTGYQFSALIDERTTATCLKADGLVLRKDVSTTIKLTPPLHFQALPIGTKILSRVGTKHQWINIENMKVGDWVLTHNKRWQKVSETMRHETWDEEIVIDLGNSRSLVATDDHPILTSRGWVQAKDLNVEDSVIAIDGPCGTCGQWTRGRFCSSECKYEAYRVHRYCKICKKEILMRGKKKPFLYCSMDCRNIGQRRLPIKSCLNCKKEIRSTWKNPKNRTRRFCSFHCYHSYKGETLLEATVRIWLEENSIPFKQFAQFGRYTVDFYIPQLNIALEVDGEYWHIVKTKRPEIIARRETFLLNHGLTIVRIPERIVNSGKFIPILKKAVYGKANTLSETSKNSKNKQETMQ